MAHSEKMMAAIYAELRGAAARRLGHGQTLEPTELVHEVYLKLGERSFDSQTHFQAVAAIAMRQIIIDRARRRSAAKRGGDQQKITLSGLGVEARDEQLLDLDRALSRLESLDPMRGRLVELRVFGGMELAEIAEEMGVSLSTVKRSWRASRAWMLQALS